MEVGAKLIGMVKTNNKGSRKETIEKLTKDWPGGSDLVLRSNHMVPRVGPLIAIGYKYKVRKVLYFIVTDNSGIKQAGLPYLSNYPDQFTNVAIFPVARTLFISKFLLLLMRLNHTTVQGSLIWNWRSYVLLSVIGCGYL